MIPAGIPRVANLQYLRALQPVDDAFVAAAAVEGHPCRPGCDACCHGPFDIGAADAWLLVEGLGSLPDEARAASMRRIATAAGRQRAHLGVGSGEPVSVSLLGDDRFDELCDELHQEPCPLLVDGRCQVYPFRPQTCRMTGARYVEEPEGVDGTVELDMGCPIDLTKDYAAIRLPIDEVENAIARVESSLSLPVIGHDRTTIAIALDLILRSRVDR